jgi:hypothetical protein
MHSAGVQAGACVPLGHAPQCASERLEGPCRFHVPPAHVWCRGWNGESAALRGFGLELCTCCTCKAASTTWKSQTATAKLAAMLASTLGALPQGAAATPQGTWPRLGPPWQTWTHDCVCAGHYLRCGWVPGRVAHVLALAGSARGYRTLWRWTVVAGVVSGDCLVQGQDVGYMLVA